MADRYFVETPIEGSHARLTGAEAHHLAHVMRAKPGDRVVLFDGTGCEFSARVERIERSEIELAVSSRESVDRELRVPVTLGVSLPKQDRGRWLVEKAVELGVARLVPLLTERSLDRHSPAALDRLRRSVVEASKQCGRNRLMEISAAQHLHEYLSAESTGTRWLAHPGGETDDRLGVAVDASSADAIRLAVGPEGGFTNTEVAQAAAAGWRVVSFGSRILRVETAALAMVAKIALELRSH
jgi:16S rRNA (uracil1498-N3)-methyltransferase